MPPMLELVDHIATTHTHISGEARCWSHRGAYKLTLHELEKYIRDCQWKLDQPPSVGNILDACEFMLYTCSLYLVLLGVLRGSLTEQHVKR
jgi:hypothetical protein